MTFPEQTPDPDHFVQWKGNMEGDYVYSMGVAGERFFRELVESGEILAAPCPECETTWLPPRIYCPSCFQGLDPETFEPVDGPATVQRVTVQRVDLDGNELDEPEVYGLVGFDGTDGGLLHRLLVDDPQSVEPGDAVQPVLKDAGDREGLITDIEGFERV